MEDTTWRKIHALADDFQLDRSRFGERFTHHFQPPSSNGHTNGNGQSNGDSPTIVHHQNIDDFLAEPEPEYDWVVPNLLDRGERVTLIGEEGHGKSTLCRQVLVQVASGVHPFTLEVMPPVTSLLIDLENPRRHLRRKLAILREIAGNRLDPSRLIIKQHEPIDLTQDDKDRHWLHEVIRDVCPDLIYIGPRYKMALSHGQPAEEVAKRVSGFIDRLRNTYGFAFLMEDHMGNGEGDNRPNRPIDSSVWRRWPEFGLRIRQSGSLTHWRVPRDERPWPAMLKRGGEWPWTVETEPVISFDPPSKGKSRGKKGGVLRVVD
jgi:hypothetical protein